MCTNFQTKRQLWFFGLKFDQNWILGSKFQKSKSQFGISILEIPCVPIFGQKRQLWIFGHKFAQKWILGSEFQKFKSGINTANKPCVPIFSQNGQLLIFGLNLGKFPNYVQYFGSNIVEGVAESRVEVEMSWVEVDGVGSSWVEVNGTGWRWVQVLVIPKFYYIDTIKSRQKQCQFVYSLLLLTNYKNI